MHRVRIEDIIAARMQESWADSRVGLCAQRLFSFLFCCLQSAAALCSVLFIYKTNTAAQGVAAPTIAPASRCCQNILPEEQPHLKRCLSSKAF